MKYNLPNSITPRPGERVVAYQGKSKHEGTFLGYNTADELIIGIDMGSAIVIDNHLKVRPKDCLERSRPCWSGFEDSNDLVKATDAQQKELDTLLSERISPGPSYYEFIYEIWARGYEIFLVGGTVRDVIKGEDAKDVDLVTTMPFNLLGPLVDSMFGFKGYSRSEYNGFMSIGFKAGDRDLRSPFDAFIDLKNVFSYAPGTKEAQFASDLHLDHTLRDFACNSIYYDPINKFFLDPSGCGIRDAKGKKLSFVNNTKVNHPEYRKANIAFRYFKFILRGYTPTEECVVDIATHIKPIVGTISATNKIVLFQKYFMQQSNGMSNEELIINVKSVMAEYDFRDIWDKHFEPLIDKIALND